MFIPVSKPSITQREKDYVNSAMESGWISSQGPYVKKFEEAFAKKHSAEFGVACSSGTTALQLALEALKIGPGDEVIVPDFTMVASAWAVTYTGAKPVFVDCGKDLNILPRAIEEAITPRTKAIMPVHIYGRKCDMESICRIAYDYNLYVIEDSAEAHGISLSGDIACFSLFANKIVSAGEGGVCITNNPRLARQMTHLRGMAFDKNHTFLHKKFAHNFRMTNVQAAIALAQTERLEEILDTRKKIEKIYEEGLRAIDEIDCGTPRNVLWMFDIAVDNYDIRERLMAYLLKNGIETRRFFQPMTMQPMYNLEKDYSLNVFSNAYRCSRVGLYLPTYTDITPEEQQYVIDNIKKFFCSK